MTELKKFQIQTMIMSEKKELEAGLLSMLQLHQMIANNHEEKIPLSNLEEMVGLLGIIPGSQSLEAKIRYLTAELERYKLPLFHVQQLDYKKHAVKEWFVSAKHIEILKTYCQNMEKFSYQISLIEITKMEDIVPVDWKAIC